MEIQGNIDRTPNADTTLHTPPSNGILDKVREFFRYLLCCLCCYTCIRSRTTTPSPTTASVIPTAASLTTPSSGTIEPPRTTPTSRAGRILISPEPSSPTAGRTFAVSEEPPRSTMIRDPRSTLGLSRPTALLSANRYTRAELNPAWITEYILALPQTHRFDGLIVLANSLNCQPRALLAILQSIRADTSTQRQTIRDITEQLEQALSNANGSALECSGPDRNALNEWLQMAQNHENAEYHLSALSRLFTLLNKPVPVDIRYAAGDPTQTTHPAAGKHWGTLIRSTSPHHSIECRFQQGSITHRQTHVNCNVMFNPSNDSLGTRGGGGAEGAIINAVGSNNFNRANGQLLRAHGRAQRPRAQLTVPDGFVGTTTETGDLSSQGIEVLVSQVAPVRQRNNPQHDLLIRTWYNAFLQAVEYLPAEETARIASTALGAGIFGWSPAESLNAAKIALSQLPPAVAARIESFVIIDQLDPQGRGASRGDAVLDAFRAVFADNESTHSPAASPTAGTPVFPSRRPRGHRRLTRDPLLDTEISAETIRRHRSARHEASGETVLHGVVHHDTRPTFDSSLSGSIATTPTEAPTSTARPADESGDNTCPMCLEARLPQERRWEIDHVATCQACHETHVENLRRELQLSRYERPVINRTIVRLPGHENSSTGTIAMTFMGRTVDNRINDRFVAIPEKSETHYLPRNPLGEEMARLFTEINRLHLTYQIDESGTFVSAIADDNGRVSDDLPRELRGRLTPFTKVHNNTTITVSGREQHIADVDLQAHGLQPAYGLIFRIHMKTRTDGGETRHGYPDPTYPVRFLDEVRAVREKYGFQEELDTTELERLIEVERRERRIPRSR